MSLTDESKPALTIAELSQRVGQEVGLSRWFLIDQKRIDAFADATEDWQFIHVDPEAAKATPFGSTIAHGFLTLSMLSAIAYDALPRVSGLAMGVNYGFDKVRFVAPVRAGGGFAGGSGWRRSRSARRASGRAARRSTVEIEGEDKPALIADWLSLYVLAG